MKLLVLWAQSEEKLFSAGISRIALLGGPQLYRVPCIIVAFRIFNKSHAQYDCKKPYVYIPRIITIGRVLDSHYYRKHGNQVRIVISTSLWYELLNHFLDITLSGRELPEFKHRRFPPNYPTWSLIGLIVDFES